jgi:hypothetical protein
MLLTLQQGWRGFELRDFLTSQACVQHVEWDAVRYPGAGSPTPPESAGAASPTGAVKRAGRKRRTADAGHASETASQRRAGGGGKSTKARQKAGPARGKRAVAGGSTPPSALLTATHDTRAASGSVWPADEAMSSSSNLKTEL